MLAYFDRGGQAQNSNGVWANKKTVEECRRELVEVLEEWIVLKLKDKDPIPKIKDIDINIREVAPA